MQLLTNNVEVKSIKIATDGWEDHDINEICDIFSPDIKIERKNLAQFQGGIEVGIIIGIILGGDLYGLFKCYWRNCLEQS